MEREKPPESHASANREGARHGLVEIHTGDDKGKAVLIHQFMKVAGMPARRGIED